MTGVYIPRKLAERANIILEFPTTRGNTIKAYIPILENPEVSEGQNARLTSHSILARNGNLFTYTGSESRKFSFKFNITLPNIVGYIHEEGLVDKFSRQFKLFYFDKEQQIRVFLQGLNATDTALFDKAGYARNYYKSMVGNIQSIPDNLFTDFIDFLLPSDNSGATKRSNDAINLYLLWINLIRCTTINNSGNTSFGPPIVRVNYGTLYNNIPCVCHDYSIHINQAAGYDKETLTPRQVEISLNLSETRTGDFDKYEPGRTVKGDNTNGWEALITKDTMDPYNDEWSINYLEEETIL